MPRDDHRGHPVPAAEGHRRDRAALRDVGVRLRRRGGSADGDRHGGALRADEGARPGSGRPTPPADLGARRRADRRRGRRRDAPLRGPDDACRAGRRRARGAGPVRGSTHLPAAHPAARPRLGGARAAGRGARVPGAGAPVRLHAPGCRLGGAPRGGQRRSLSSSCSSPPESVIHVPAMATPGAARRGRRPSSGSARSCGASPARSACTLWRGSARRTRSWAGRARSPRWPARWGPTPTRSSASCGRSWRWASSRSRSRASSASPRSASCSSKARARRATTRSSSAT